MKTVYVADKSSYGGEFCEIHTSLDDLKKAIVNHELRFSDYTPEMYTEQLFKECKSEGMYTLFEIHLDSTEEILFSEYDGQSWHEIVIIDQNIRSISNEIEE